MNSQPIAKILMGTIVVVSIRDYPGVDKSEE